MWLISFSLFQNNKHNCKYSLVDDRVAAENKKIQLLRDSLNRALQHSSDETVTAILGDLKLCTSSTQLSELLTAQNADGWTALHFAARYGSYQSVVSIIEALGEKAHDTAEKVTYQGKLPIKLVKKHDEGIDKKKINKALKAITISKSLENLSSEISFSAMIRENSLSFGGDESLLKNLVYGCLAASHVRKIIAQSLTHPTSNCLDKEAFSLLKKKSLSLRNQYQAENKNFDILNPVTAVRQELENIETLVRQFSIGNCYEYSCLVLNTLLKMKVPSFVEVFSISNGDHVFVVIGRNPFSLANDFKNWGPSAVVVDAWAGMVYPASEIDAKLRNFFGYKNSKGLMRACITMPFEKKFHRLSADFKLNNIFFPKNKSINCDDFTLDEQAELDKNLLLVEEIQNKRYK